MAHGSGESTDSQSGENSQQHQHQQFLGDASGAIPNFDIVEVDKDLPESITQEDVDMFEHLYQQHCEVKINSANYLHILVLDNNTLFYIIAPCITYIAVR